MIITAIAMITANTFFKFNLDSVSYRLPSTHKFPPKSIFTYPTISFFGKKVKSDFVSISTKIAIQKSNELLF